MIRETIQKEVVAAMKGGDRKRTAALRLVTAKIKDRDIEQRTAASTPADDELVQDVLLKMAKQRRESIAMYDDGGREELADQERFELAVIEEFLPRQMDESETRAAIAAIKSDLAAAGLKDMGRVMAELKARHGASLDMTRASALVKESLSA
ncbi:GatB/YqeY domain-containing protein [Porphyrobacter sp. GA68]|uniref:GatB/YqeY domain-containing protein n=1 Tax=Porphyrobacter sp. GA68 TaxID=2883480 RepID=UPI001D181637|nr:GatB/YqeY domain-containing protein [Porphyrobacter sp. GA68]